ncbi:MAG: hypothetical protein FH748_05290 [Balneolaceae bacterium]|nr:hypothetical protein [Balneolaceae bacterium]
MRICTSLFILMIFLVSGMWACSSEKKEKEKAAPKIYVDLSFEEVSALSQGDEFNLSLGDSGVVHLKVRTVRSQIPGTTSIAADVEDKETGLASLILRDNKISGTVNIYSKDYMYYIKHDGDEKGYYLEEVKKEDQDILEGSKPLNTNQQ